MTSKRAKKQPKAEQATVPPPAEPLPPDDDQEPPPPNLTPKEQRIEQVVDIMVNGRWVTGVTSKALARQWNTSRANVENMACEANRVIRRWMRETPEDKKAALARVLQSFERIAKKLEAKDSERGLTGAAETIDRFAEYSGLKPAKTLQVKDITDPFKGWTDEEIEHFGETGERPTRAIA
jgi:hypothetical protein